MTHRMDKERRSAWRILRDAGLYTILSMGAALIALAIGCGIGTRMLG